MFQVAARFQVIGCMFQVAGLAILFAELLYGFPCGTQIDVFRATTRDCPYKVLETSINP